MSSRGASLPSDLVRYEVAEQFGVSTPFLLQSKWYICGYN